MEAAVCPVETQFILQSGHLFLQALIAMSDWSDSRPLSGFCYPTNYELSLRYPVGLCHAAAFNLQVCPLGMLQQFIDSVDAGMD